MTTALLGHAILFNKAFAQDAPKLDELKTKHDLANPNRNHTSDELPTNIQNILASPPPPRIDPVNGMRFQESKIKNSFENFPDTTPAIPIGISAYPTDPTDPNYKTGAQKFNDQTGLAINIGQTHGQPSGTIVGNQLSELDLQYSRSGTRKFVRDPVTGKLELKTIEGVPRVSGLPDNELYGEEINNTKYEFQQNKQAIYGDDQAMFDEGKVTHDSFKDPTVGQTGAARGYRVITSSATQANNTTLSENAAWIQPSFTALRETEDGSAWVEACTETTIVNDDTYNYQTSTEQTCQDTSQSNLDSCQVERIYREPLTASGGGLTSCGPGCYELKLGETVNNYYDPPGNCGVFSGSRAVTLNLVDGIVLDRVTVQGYVDDHVEFTVNGSLAFSVIRGVISNSAPLPPITWSGCEAGYDSGTKNGRWHFSGDRTSAFSPHINAGVSSVYTLGWNVLVGGKGEINASIRFYFNDSTGNNFNSRYEQIPEGCYDALSDTDKLTNPLDGVYDEAASLPPVTYSCTSSSRAVNCPLGSIPVGTGVEASCHNPAQLSDSCDIGVLNSSNGLCEIDGVYSCPIDALNGLRCNGSNVIAPDAELVGEQCVITDLEHCGGGWSQTLPAVLNCPVGFSESGGICTSLPESVYSCADGSLPEQTIIDGTTYYYCVDDTVAGGSFTAQDWSCDGGGSLIPENCIITRGSSSDTAICFEEAIDPSYVHPESFCTFDDYSIIEEGDRGFTAASLASVPPFFTGDTGNKTWIVNLDGYRCDPTNGEFFCRTDPITQVETCMTWEEFRELPNQCQPYIDDVNCSEVSRSCSDGWLEQQTGRCMADDVTFECVEDNAVDFDNQQTTNICAGMLPCSGNECEIGTPEGNTKFVDAMVAGSIADNLQGDSTCSDPADPTTCKIFPGEFEYCSWEVTGLGTDCCEKAKGVDIISYIILSRQLLKVNQMASAGAFGDGVAGVSNTLSEPITSAYDAVSSWAADGIRSASDTLFGNAETVSGGVSAVSEGITAALGAVQQAAFELIYDIAPDALKDFLFENATEFAADSTTELVMNEAVTNALSNIMAIYTVYNLTKLALTLLTACDDNEMDMSVKLAQRQCFTVGGSYCSDRVLGVCYQKRQNHCCYSSILARIIMKEAYTQLPIDPLPFGNSPSEGLEMDASCAGITAAELSQLDFNTPSMQAGLQEWTGLLLEAGQIPTETSEAYLTGGATPEARTDCPIEQVPRLSCFLNELGQTVCEQQRDAGGNLLYDTRPSDCGGKLTGGAQIFNAADRDVASERIVGPNGYIGTAADRAEEARNLIRTLPGALDCSLTPDLPVCRFGFDPTEPPPNN